MLSLYASPPDRQPQCTYPLPLLLGFIMPLTPAWLRQVDSSNESYIENQGRLFMSALALPTWHPLWPTFALDANWFPGDDLAMMGPAAYELFKVHEHLPKQPFRYGFRDFTGVSKLQHDAFGKASNIILVEGVNDWFIKVPWSAIHLYFELDGPGAKNLYAGLYASAPEVINLRARNPSRCFDFRNAGFSFSYP